MITYKGKYIIIDEATTPPTHIITTWEKVREAADLLQAFMANIPYGEDEDYASFDTSIADLREISNYAYAKELENV